jgi:predicted HTH domain antitoxin
MAQHAVRTATSLYESGTLTLEQAAQLAGVTPGRLRVRLRMQGVEVPDPESAAPEAAVAAE